ncbi:hypothetical protein [uncultured Roseibium sp.]|uniref:hypothetical protein n=1 Tax=uncultured Roseibium sp. TaxID=1936171 RepID=UPI002596FA54|nr:hypothetical protein [uncultured Roseibium sp.]
MSRIFLLFAVLSLAFGSLAEARNDLPRLGRGTLSAAKTPVKGGLNVWAACATKEDYRKLHKAVVQRTKAHNRAFDAYFDENLNKGLSKKKRSEEFRKLYRKLENNKRELSKINERSKYGAPLAVKCKKFSKTQMVIEKNAAFGNHICVRPAKGGKCGWTDKRAFKGYYRVSKDSKIWNPVR